MKSFLQGKRSLDIVALRAPNAGTKAVGAACTPAEPVSIAGSSPHIEIVKQGDKIMRIVVTCTCGERTEIECLYSPGQ
jgi:poly(3-hydroxybutyrate) depolymerase